jgi:endonuclease G
MNFKLRSFYLSLFFLITTYGFPINASSNIDTLDSIPRQTFRKISKLEEPKIYPKEKIVRHFAYSLVYDTSFRIAKWVAYALPKENLNGQYERTNIFMPDPELNKYTNNDEDYKSSGFDKGHLAPAADMRWSQTAITESFYYSNMTPQKIGFNRGIWSRLEAEIRGWVGKEEILYIVCGPVLEENLNRIGKNKISVPNLFFKAVLAYHPPVMKGIAFLIPNNDSKDDLKNYAISIDSLESIINLDLFPLLPDLEEKHIEETFCPSCWGSEKTVKYSSININNQNSHNSTQCGGLTTKGTRCKNKTTNKSGYCHLHQGK